MKKLASLVLASVLAVGMGLLISVVAAAEMVAVEAKATDLRNTNGNVWFCLWKDGATEGFPRCDKGQPFAKLSAPASSAAVVFKSVPLGTYAVSMFHDEKSTGVPELNLVGLPKSGVGLSNNPQVGITSPPNFGKAKFTLEKNIVLSIQAKYLF